MRLQTALFLAVFALACGGDDDAPDTTSPGGITNAPGTTTTRHLTVSGVQREFMVYVGATVGANANVPVVFMLHGTSGTGEEYYNISQWKQKADAEGLIAVFPTALTYCFHEDENKDGDFTDPGDQHVNTKWTHGDLGNPAKMPLCTAQEIAGLNAANRALTDHPLYDDISFFDAMVAFVKTNYRVDSKRFFVSGFSNGAQMANRLATERSTTFAATAAPAGGLSVPNTNGRAMSVVVSVGTLDDRYTAALGVQAIPLGPNTLTQYPLLAGILFADMLTQLHLTQAYTYDELIVAGKRVGRWTFKTSTIGASNSLQFLLFEDNYHMYPNGSSYPVVMANVLWTFFTTQQLP